ncbi:type VII secretion-associated serine protease mycosin [Mycobacterium sp. SM1]|uniref:type VII secretion-associated serine protease mycosin n=1 Tax=Mycobacterium sp. SM1 TaxID=2816243 RepID=UPI001BD1586B|nr:type VII secretion-associated serine protease mycosin [Mycobacterium sp. SM1]MBS4729737.1 type VII secretion-associated serine protease mycosin [Mycobacterium sp. SM1]
MQRSATASSWLRHGRAAAATAATILVVTSTVAGAPAANAIAPPTIDPAAMPPDDPPGPLQPMRQSAYCTEVGVLPGTNFQVPPKYLAMLNLPAAWQFGRGGGVKVAVIDTGVAPHPRLPHLVPGGDYVMAGGDGLSDCDAHGTLVASMLAAEPATAVPAAPDIRIPQTYPTPEAPPPPPPPQTVTLKPAPPPPPETVRISQPPPPAPWLPPPPPVTEKVGPPSEEEAPSAYGGHGKAVLPGYSERGHVHGVDNPHPRDPAPPEPPAPPSPAPPAAPAAATPGQPTDAFTGIAPDVEVISIRQSSAAFTPKDPFTGSQDPQTAQKINNMETMARAIVHAANMGARVINISGVTCMSVRNIIHHPDLGAAVRYAAVDKDAVIVAAAGDTSQRDCKQNPVYNPLRPDDPRDWSGVDTVVTPAWFSDYVLTVGAVDSTGAPMSNVSMAGPWVSIAAPGDDIEGFSPRDDSLINAIEGPNNSLLVPAGTSFATAIVSGVAALVRAKYPQLSSHQVINRLIRTARPPARGVDNQVGYGVVDPVAALTWDVPDGPIRPPNRLSAPLKLPPPAPARDMTPVWVAAGGLGAVVLVAGVVFGGAMVMRRSARSR